MYLNMNLIFDVRTNDKHCVTMVKRYRVFDRISIVCSHTNPFFDTCEDEIYFTDGMRYKYSVTIIVDNMYAQVDDEGHKFQLLVDIQ